MVFSAPQRQGLAGETVPGFFYWRFAFVFNQNLLDADDTDDTESHGFCNYLRALERRFSLKDDFS
jgi:hypothetical protein